MPKEHKGLREPLSMSTTPSLRGMPFRKLQDRFAMKRLQGMARHGEREIVGHGKTWRKKTDKGKRDVCSRDDDGHGVQVGGMAGTLG